MAANKRDIRLVVRTEVEKALKDFQKLEKEETKVQQKSADLGDEFRNLKAGVAGFVAALGIREVARFSIETALLDDKATNLRRSFDRLATKEGLDAKKLMVDLKEATGGTVDELELMAKSNYAKNLGVNFKAIPTLLKFARVQAKEMGQDVDYMTESILTGLGRKSPLILDNLGLTMAGLNKYVKEIALEQGKWNGKITTTLKDLYLEEAAVRLANDKLEEYGEITEGAGDKMARNKAIMQDVRVNFGALTKEFVNNGLDDVNSKLDKLAMVLDRTVENAESDRLAFNGLMKQLIEYNGVASRTSEEEERRSEIIKILNSNYGEYLGNIDLETAGNDKLKTSLESINKEMEKKILILAAEEQVQKYTKEAVKHQSEIMKLTRKKAEFEERYQEMLDSGKKSVFVGPVRYDEGSFKIRIKGFEDGIDRIRELRDKARSEAAEFKKTILEETDLTSAGSGGSGGDDNKPSTEVDAKRTKELEKQAAYLKKMSNENEVFFAAMKSPVLAQLLALRQWYDEQVRLYGESEELIVNYGAKRMKIEEDFVGALQEELEKKIELQEVDASSATDDYFEGMRRQIEEITAYMNTVEDVIRGPFEGLLVDLMDFQDAGSAFKSFADSAIGNLKRLVAQMIAATVIKTALGAAFGVPTGGIKGIIKGVLGIAPGAADGAFIKKRAGGTLVPVGEGDDDEVIIPVNRFGAFLSGQYKLPGGYGIEKMGASLNKARLESISGRAPAVNVGAPVVHVPQAAAPQVNLINTLPGQTFVQRTVAPGTKNLDARKF